jgi:predicted site-specific integrase-resolvase
LLPVCRTEGGHRRYDLLQVREHFGLNDNTERKTICYARVSSHDQREQLTPQAERLRQHCQAQGYARTEVITDLGSGMNYKKRGLKQLIAAILSGTVERVVLVTKDRLLRFGSELLFSICKFFSVEVVVLDATPAIAREQQLTEDLIEILTVFSSRLYGSRSRKNLKALAASAVVAAA